MPTQPPNITPVPQPPIQRGDRATFSSRVDAFITWLAAAVAQFMAVATNVYNNAVEAFQSASAAASSALVASGAATAAAQGIGATPWVSGKQYAQYEYAISPVNSQTYRRRVAGSGTIDPSNDSTNWALPAGDGSFIPNVVGGSSVDLSLGNYHTKAQSGNTTYTFDKTPQAGYSFTLELTITSGLVVLPSSVKTPDDVPYTLTIGKTHLLMFVTVNRGTRWRLAAATNYTT